jgi:hypothetical protein
LPALEHHTCTEDDVEGGIKIKKTLFFMKWQFFTAEVSKKEKENFGDSKSPLLDVRRFANHSIKKYLPYRIFQKGFKSGVAGTRTLGMRVFVTNIIFPDHRTQVY